MAYEYQPQEIQKKVAISIGVLLRNDYFLLQSGASERSVSHKLAEYLQIQFPDWNVDCEYNRKGPDPKRLDGIKECSEQKKTDRIFPDIIVHRRNTHDNLLVIEMKIGSEDDPCDIKKLKLLTSRRGRYKYRIGLFAKFDSRTKISLRWFADGKSR